MGTSGSLKVQRPYDSREAYLEGDSWTVSRSEVLLVGAGELPEGAALRFEIALATGEVVVRGEGRAMGTVNPDAGRPGGLRVRLQRLDTESKGMLKRALEVQKRNPAAARPDEMKSAPEASLPAIAAVSSAEPKDVETSPLLPVEDARTGVALAPPERSGVRHRAVGPIVAPENRNTLLARLRERAPQGAVAISAKRRTAGE